MAKVKLSSQRGQTVGLSKMSPVLFNSSAAAGAVRGGQINPNAGRIGFKGLTPNTIQKDVVTAALEGGANVMETYNEAAFRYNERNEQAQADEAVVAFNRRTRESFIGRQGDEGKFEEGYSSSSSKSAIEGYDGYVGGLKKDLNDTLMALPEGVRKKAAIRMSEITTRMQERAAMHRVQQEGVYRQEVQYSSQQDMMAEIDDRGAQAILDGTVKANIDKYFTTQQEKDTAWGAVIQQAYRNKYNKTLGETGSQLQAVQAAAEVFQAAEGNLSEEHANAFRYDLQNTEAAARKAHEKDMKEAIAIAQEDSAQKAPSQMINGIKAGSYDIVGAEIQNIRSLYSTKYDNDPEKGSKAVVDALKSTFSQRANGFDLANPEARLNMSINDKQARVQKDAEDFIKYNIANGVLSKEESLQLENYLQNELPNELFDKQDSDDRTFIARTMLEKNSRRERGEAGFLQVVEPPKSMLPANRKEFMKMQKEFSDESREGIKAEVQAISIASKRNVDAILIDRPMSKEEEQMLFNQIGKTITAVDYAKAKEQSDFMKSPQYKKEEYKKTAEWDKGKEYIEAYYKAFLSDYGMSDKKSRKKARKDPEAYAQGRADIVGQRSAAHIAFDRAMKAHAMGKTGGQFNVEEWWKGYILSNNAGSPIKTSKFRFSGPNEPVAGFRTLAAADEKIREEVSDFLFGNPELKKAIYGE